MNGWNRGGVQLYCGKTRSGKTTAAIADAEAAAAETGYPIITLDLMRAMSFAHLPHALSGREVCEAAFVTRTRPKIWSPDTEEERAEFWRLLAYFGGCHVVVDEIRKMSSSAYVERGFVQAVNVWGHGKLGPTTYHLTAQRVGFVHRDIWPAFDRVHVFCPAPGRDARIIEEELGVNRDDSESLEQGEQIIVELGFSPRPPEVPRPGNGNPAPPGGAGHEEERAALPEPADKPSPL